jgi:uncharacterized protein YdeI (YjbR/CyaY-like superfamily)
MNRTNGKPALAEKEPEAKVPADLRRALAAVPVAKGEWRELTPIARRDFISWIEQAKQEETRRRRIERACSMLAQGKRRPCCYAVVPLYLYTALKAAPKAKAKWSELTPTARRDFISWIESAKEPEERKRRTAKASAILAAGKQRP